MSKRVLIQTWCVALIMIVIAQGTAVNAQAMLVIGDKVWEDSDGDGTAFYGLGTPNNGSEAGVDGVTVRLYEIISGGELLLETDTTDSLGRYSFIEGQNGLEISEDSWYQLEFVINKPGWGFTNPDTPTIYGHNEDQDSDVLPSTGRTIVFAIDSDDHDSKWDAGILNESDPPGPLPNFFPPQYACYEIGDRAWIDADSNGTYDGLEDGVNDVKVSLYQLDSEKKRIPVLPPVVVNTASGGDGAEGFYEYCVLSAYYEIEFDIEPAFAPTGGYELTVDNIGVLDNIDSDPYKLGWVEKGTTIAFSVGRVQGGSVMTDNSERWDVGSAPITSCINLGDTVWSDANGNGEYEPVESVLPGVDVELWKHHTGSGQPGWIKVQSDTTDSQGEYQFTCVSPADRMLILIRRLGLASVSQFYDPDPMNMEDLDNNGRSADSLWRGEYQDIIDDSQQSGGVVAATEEFRLDATHPSNDVSIDFGIQCLTSNVDIMLVLDVSGTMASRLGPTTTKTRMEAMKEAAKTIVNMLEDGGSNKIGIVRFASQGVEVQELTNDTSLLNSAVDSLDWRDDNYSNMAEGIEKATDEFAENSTVATKAMWIISDGLPSSVQGREAQRELAITRASEARSAGIRVMTVTTGEDTQSIMRHLVAHVDDSYDMEFGLHSIARAFISFLSLMCTDSISPLPCTGADAFEIPLLATGKEVTGGRDGNWDVLAPSSTRQDAYLVTSVPSAWGEPLAGDSEWISYVATGDSAPTAGEEYDYLYSFSLSGQPSWAELKLDLMADDDVVDLLLNDTSLGLEWERAFERPRRIELNTGIIGNLEVQNDLAIRVLDKYYKTGLNAHGVLRGCTGGAGGTGPSYWRPREEEACDFDTWLNGSSNKNVPPGVANEGNEFEKAYCMQIQVACWFGSKIQPVGGQYCFTMERDGADICYPSSTCATGKYDFPVNQSFDIGIRNYAAIWPNAEMGWPDPNSSQPGRLKIFSALGEPVEDDQIFRNADKSVKRLSNVMERYISTCIEDSSHGCLMPPGASTTYQWVSWESVTHLPFRCPPGSVLPGCYVPGVTPATRQPTPTFPAPYGP